MQHDQRNNKSNIRSEQKPEEHSQIAQIDLLRNARASLIKSLFASPDLEMEIFVKVLPLLEKQFGSDDKKEVGGAVDIDLEQGTIKFRIVESSFYLSVSSALSAFKEGKQRDAAPVLIDAIEKFTADQPQDFKMNVINHEKSVYSRLKQLLAGQIDQVSDSSSRKLISLIEHGLRYSYFVFDSDLQVHKREFAASFHIHSCGTPPSQLDLDNSALTDFPDLVISAKPDYKNTGLISIYLVNNNSYDLVFQSGHRGK